MEESKRKEVEKRGIFNENGDIDLAKRKIIQGNTTNLNDFNNLKYKTQAEITKENKPKVKMVIGKAKNIRIGSTTF